MVKIYHTSRVCFTYYKHLPVKNGRKNHDRKLLAAIQHGGKERLLALESIYRETECRELSIRYLMSRGCLKHDAEDIFQDAIIIFDKKVSKGEFRGDSSIQNFIISIVKHCWLNHYRKIKRRKSLIEVRPPEPEIGYAVDKYYGMIKKRDMMKKILSSLGPRCKKILMMFCYRYETEHIATATGMSGPVQVRKEKYRCLNRMRIRVSEDPEFARYIKNHLSAETE